MNRSAISSAPCQSTARHLRGRRILALILSPILVAGILFGGGTTVHRASSHGAEFSFVATSQAPMLPRRPRENPPLRRHGETDCQFCLTVGSGYAFTPIHTSWTPAVTTSVLAQPTETVLLLASDIPNARGPRAPPLSLHV